MDTFNLHNVISQLYLNTAGKKFLSVRNIYTIPKFNQKWTTDLNMNVRIKNIKLLKHWSKFVILDQAMDS